VALQKAQRCATRHNQRYEVDALGFHLRYRGEKWHLPIVRFVTGAQRSSSDSTPRRRGINFGVNCSFWWNRKTEKSTMVNHQRAVRICGVENGAESYSTGVYGPSEVTCPWTAPSDGQFERNFKQIRYCHSLTVRNTTQ
jgi:hypothetical protein